MNKQMYINGALTAGHAGERALISPASEGQYGSVAWGNAQDAQAALDAAAAAFDSWAITPIAERISWMHQLRDAVIDSETHLRDCVQQETGKTWAQTQEDYDSLVNSLKFYAEEITRLRAESPVDREGSHTHRLIYEPAGVAVAFIAWNFPLLNLAFKIGPAMAAGCPIVIKPSPKTPLAAYGVGELCEKIGLPPGVVNIVCGDDAEVGDTLSASTIPALLTLIGSIRTGRHIMKNGATSIKRYSMELGGNAPVLVLADADLDLAADIVCAVKFGCAGQICVTPNRVFVDERVQAAFAEKVVQRANAVKVGFGKDSDADMGPLIDGAAFERVDALVQEAAAAGARLLAGGGRAAGLARGHFYAPTVLSSITPAMRIYSEEIFGPVVALISFRDEAAALAAANDTDTGLTAYIFTRDMKKAEQFAARLRFGEIQINGVKYSIELPHVGIRQSGIGCDCSHLALHEYVVTKRISRALTA